MATIAYARVSTEGQTLDAQIDQLTAAGADRIFREKISGARSDRAALIAAIGALQQNDIFLVTRLDRLARSTRDLLNIMASIAERKAAFRSLSDVWADSTTPHGRLLLTILGGLAEFERELIRARTSEGRLRAKNKGIRMGRKPKLTSFQMREARERHAAGESAAAIARSFAVNRSTVSRLLNQGKDHNLEDDGFIESTGPLPLDAYIRRKLLERASSRAK